MSAIRQDAWTDDEDLLLAETVLRHIREGSTQLAAFEEVGKSLSRTPAACGFRWNSLIRKRYENAISLAKKQRKELNKKTKSEVKKRERPEVKLVEIEQPQEEAAGLNLKTVIAFLEQLADEGQEENALKAEVQGLKNQVEVLQNERIELIRTNQRIKEDFNAIKEDYQALITIMDRARRFTDSSPEESDWKEVTEALSVSNEKE